MKNENTPCIVVVYVLFLSSCATEPSVTNAIGRTEEMQQQQKKKSKQHGRSVCIWAKIDEELKKRRGPKWALEMEKIGDSCMEEGRCFDAIDKYTKILNKNKTIIAAKKCSSTAWGHNKYPLTNLRYISYSYRQFEHKSGLWEMANLCFDAFLRHEDDLNCIPYADILGESRKVKLAIEKLIKLEKYKDAVAMAFVSGYLEFSTPDRIGKHFLSKATTANSEVEESSWQLRRYISEQGKLLKLLNGNKFINDDELFELFKGSLFEPTRPKTPKLLYLPEVMALGDVVGGGIRNWEIAQDRIDNVDEWRHYIHPLKMAARIYINFIYGQYGVLRGGNCKKKKCQLDSISMSNLLLRLILIDWLSEKSSTYSLVSLLSASEDSRKKEAASIYSLQNLALAFYFHSYANSKESISRNVSAAMLLQMPLIAAYGSQMLKSCDGLRLVSEKFYQKNSPPSLDISLYATCGRTRKLSKRLNDAIGMLRKKCKGNRGRLDCLYLAVALEAKGDAKAAAKQYKEAASMTLSMQDKLVDMKVELKAISKVLLRRAKALALGKNIGTNLDQERVSVSHLDSTIKHKGEWVTIPSGSFKMGSTDGYDNENPVHMVHVKGFQMMKTEVSVDQYRACVTSGKCSNPTTFDSSSKVEKNCNWGKDDHSAHPVNCVDWKQARDFCRFAGGRLPSAAEWEYAARSGGRDWKYPWGDEKATCSRAVMYEGGKGGCGQDSITWPVCSKTAGNSSQGLCDMAGNVEEWVEDCLHDSYYGAPSDGSAWTSGCRGTDRMLRGSGAFGTAKTLRATFRSSFFHDYRSYKMGFRCVR